MGAGVATDEHGQVGAWLVKLLLVMGVLGFVAIEVGSPLVNRLQAQDLAGLTATEANLVYDRGRDVEAARRRAVAFVGDKAEVVTVWVDQSERRLFVTLRRKARTILIHRIERLEHLTEVTVTDSAPLRM